MGKQRRRVILSVLGYFLLVSPTLETPGLLAESLEEAARREGRVLFYSGMSTEDSHTLIGAFQKKYPFLKAEFYRANESRLFQRLVTEKQMGQNFADVMHMAGIWVNMYEKEGLLGKYVSPEAKNFPPGFKDPEGFWTAHYTTYHVFIHNTRLVPKKDLPKTYEDLLHPRWKRQIGMSSDELEWFMGMLDMMGEEKGKQYMQRLAAQEPILRAGRTLTATLMVAGEFPLALGVVHRTLEQQKSGASVDIIPLPGHVLAAIRAIGVNAQAAHPNAARLLVDFILSREGQTIFNRISRHPVRPDVKVDPVVEKIRQNLFPIKPRPPEVVQRFKREYDRIFLKRH